MAMENQSGLRAEEMEVDPQLGYPKAYAKLCNYNTNTHIQMPYYKGPPYTFLPYPLHPQHMEKVKELNELFPVTLPGDADPPNAKKYIDVLWKQLDHLGNAGFDPSLFRVDPYGNVLYFHADPASPLAWEVDHWFPRSRGGKTVPTNLRLVQWQVKQVKQNNLEFLMPWWDLQLGVSVNQFLSIFASKNADFRQRAFSSIFFSGKSELLNEIMVVECHSWPQHFLAKKRQLGLAPAAIVRVQKDTDNTLKALNINRSIIPGAPTSRRWAVEEDDTHCKAIQKFRPVYEDHEFEPFITNDFNMQTKEKHYWHKEGDWEREKENMGDLHNSKMKFSGAIQTEVRLKVKREDEIRKKQEEISQLDQELKELKKINEAERLALEDLEYVLIKHRRRTEKQRRLAETQASYKQCIEKMIRDIMHQNVVYKEQARLNQGACNALMARLESLKADSDMSERDLLKKFKQKEDIQELLRPYSEQVRKRLREDDTASCSKKNVKKELRRMRSSCPSAIMSAQEKGKESVLPIGHVEALKQTTLLVKNMEGKTKKIQKELRQFLEEDMEASRIEALKEHDAIVEKVKRGAIIDGHEKVESVADNDNENRACEYEAKEDELDDALQQVLAMQRKAEAARTDANAEEEKNEDEDERIKRIGKANLDKWLQLLLHNTEAGVLTDDGQGKTEDCIALEIEKGEEQKELFGGVLSKMRNEEAQNKYSQALISVQAKGNKKARYPNALKRNTLEKEDLVRIGEEEEFYDGLDPSQIVHGIKSTQVGSSLYTLPAIEKMIPIVGIQKSKHKKTSLVKDSDTPLHNKGVKTKIEMANDLKHMPKSKGGKEECILKRSGSARRGSSPSLWGIQRRTTNAFI